MPFLHRLPLQLFTWPLIRGQLIPAALFDAHLSPSTFNYKGAVFVDLRSSPSDVERLTDFRGVKILQCHLFGVAIRVLPHITATFILLPFHSLFVVFCYDKRLKEVLALAFSNKTHNM